MRGSDTPSSWELRTPIKNQKGPNGRPLCTWCHKEVPIGRRTWCSGECVDQYRMATDWQYLSRKVYERDKAICQSCGVDTKEIPYKKWRRRAHDIDHIIPVEHGGKSVMENLQTLCVSCHRAKTAKQAREKAIKRRVMPLFQGVLPIKEREEHGKEAAHT